MAADAKFYLEVSQVDKVVEAGDVVYFSLLVGIHLFILDVVALQRIDAEVAEVRVLPQVAALPESPLLRHYLIC